jgi:uncharacterized membrane protein YccC
MASSSVQQHSQQLRVRLAVKVTLGAVLWAIIGSRFHLNLGYLSSLVVALVLVVFHGRTLRAGLPGALGIIVAGSVQALLTLSLSDAPAAYLLCSLLWLFLWMAFLPALPLAHSLGGILIAMIPFTFALGSMGIHDLLLAFWLQCSLAFVVSIGLDQLLWPAKPEDAYFESLAMLLDSFADDVDLIDTPRATGPRAKNAHLTEVRAIARLANLSQGTHVGESAAMLRLNLACRMIWERIQLGEQFVLRSHRDDPPDAESVQILSIIARLARHYRAVSRAALAQQPAPPVDAETEAASRDLIHRLRAAETDPEARPTAMDHTAARVLLLERGLESHTQVVDAYNEVLATLASRRNLRLDIAAVFKQMLSPPSVAALQSAGRLVIIVLCLFIAVVYLHFPGGSLVAFYGITFGLTSNIGQLYMRGRSGVVGVLAGIAMGFAGVLIVTHSPYFPVLLGVFAIVMFIAAYASTAPDPIGFAGMQAALITPYVFLTYEGPLWTVENAMTRVAALMVAAVIAMVIQRILWPRDPLVIFRTVVAEMLDRIEETWERLREGEQTTLAHPLVALKIDASATLLSDSRYVIGTRHPIASTYLNLLHALQDLFARMQTLAELRRMADSDARVQQAMRDLAPELLIVTRALERISGHLRSGHGGTGRRALDGLPEELAQVRSAGERIRQECPPEIAPATRSQLLVLGTLLCEITDSLTAAVASAKALPAVAPLSMLGSSEGWRASATANPAH